LQIVTSNLAIAGPRTVVSLSGSSVGLYESGVKLSARLLRRHRASRERKHETDELLYRR